MKGLHRWDIRGASAQRPTCDQDPPGRRSFDLSQPVGQLTGPAPSDNSEVTSVGPGGAPPHIDEVGRVMAASGKVK
jgi:hypothetical protein